jgi:lipopolysaccharide transport system ATP-binding protein
VGWLFEVGTGSPGDSELTGRENIYLNGATLGVGMRRAEIDRQFADIVAFAETCAAPPGCCAKPSRSIERFVDTPVKRYSSSMYVCLAFAVAAHPSSGSGRRLEPEILLVDEVLAVGDAAFQ